MVLNYKLQFLHLNIMISLIFFHLVNKHNNLNYLLMMMFLIQNLLIMLLKEVRSLNYNVFLILFHIHLNQLNHILYLNLNHLQLMNLKLEF